MVSNQVSFSLLDQRAARGLAPYCVEHGVQLLAYGTLAGGWLTERWLGAAGAGLGTHRTWSQMKYGRFMRVAGGWDALQRVLRPPQRWRRGMASRSPTSRAASSSISRLWPASSSARGSASAQHIDDTLRLFSLALTDDDRAEIRAALATLQPIPGDCGDEYRRPPFLTASGDLSHHLDSMPPPYAA